MAAGDGGVSSLAPVDRFHSSRPSSTEMVVWNDEWVAPRTSWQFHPPSGIAAPTRSLQSSRPSDSAQPKCDEIASTIPLTHRSAYE